MKRITLFIVTLFVFLTGCNSLQVNRCNPFYAMNTIIQVTFYNENDYEIHYNNIRQIYSLYDEISSSYTSSDKQSVYDLNEKRSIEASNELMELINYSLELKTQTNNYFNPLLGNLSNKWKEFISGDGSIPNEEEITGMLDIANNTSVLIDGNDISLVGDGLLDLGGIAKGYATQKVCEYLEDAKVEGYLINAGDSNIALGKKGDDSFTVGLSKPYSEGFILTLETNNIAIGTSSPKYQYKDYEGKRYHHIINPNTGYQEEYYDSVSVFLDNSALADAYSTAIFSMNLEDAKSFIEEKGIKAVLYKGQDIIYRSIDL